MAGSLWLAGPLWMAGLPGVSASSSSEAKSYVGPWLLRGRRDRRRPGDVRLRSRRKEVSTTFPPQEVERETPGQRDDHDEIPRFSTRLSSRGRRLYTACPQPFPSSSTWGVDLRLSSRGTAALASIHSRRASGSVPRVRVVDAVSGAAPSGRCLRWSVSGGVSPVRPRDGESRSSAAGMRPGVLGAPGRASTDPCRCPALGSRIERTCEDGRSAAAPGSGHGGEEVRAHDDRHRVPWPASG